MKITVIGAGSWGTALALHFSQHGNRVSLWTRNADQVRQMQEARENKRDCPAFPFPKPWKCVRIWQRRSKTADLSLS